MQKSRNRRDILKTLGLGTAAAAMPNLLCSSEPATRPNIVLIMADDFGYECLACNGGTSYETPNFDALARSGMRFEHFYSTPLCTPTRVQIMTGKFTHRNYVAFGILDPKEKTFAHMLQEAGYTTCVAGKWQLYPSTPDRKKNWTGTYPTEAGFNEFCLWQVSEVGNRYADPLLQINSREPQEYKGEYGPDICTDYILDFIERNSQQPFLVYYPMILTHDPFLPTPDSDEWADGDRHKRDDKYFGDMVSYADKLVGRIVSKLEKLGLRENTLIMFLGDNGSPRQITSKMGDREILGRKSYTVDAGMHVPLIASWTSTIPAGSVNTDLVDCSDILPTFAEVCGASVPEPGAIDGRSFSPQLHGKKGNPREWIFCHYKPRPKNDLLRFAFDKKFKLYHDDRFYHYTEDLSEEYSISNGQGTPEAEQAREKLANVLKSME